MSLLLVLILAGCGPPTKDHSSDEAFECLCPDDDGDDFASPCSVTCESTDPDCTDCDCDGYANDVDCDDHEDSVHPGQDDGRCDACEGDINCDGLVDEDAFEYEICDGLDNDCDNLIDEGVISVFE